jgi:multidrug resistance efflux pump
METLRRTINVFLLVGIVAAGAAVMLVLIRTKPAPPTIPGAQKIASVSVSQVRGQETELPVVGYGTVRPKNQVNIVPQVSGKLVYAHSALAQGNVIPTGELLFEIDPTRYEATVRQVQAEIGGLDASLQRHDQEIINLDARIANLEEMLSIDEKDYLTSKKLYEVDKVGTERDVDQLYQKYLRQKDVVVDLGNRRAMAPIQRMETGAQLDAARARLTQAEYDLAGTKIPCPFEARVEAVGAHASQVVTAHLSIATLTDMSAFELSVGIDPRELRWLDEAIRPEALDNTGAPYGPEVAVSWSLPGQEFTWRGYVTRFERVDEATRTARLVVEVRNLDMVATLNSGSGDILPALSIGMHCRADLPAQPLEDALLIPRHAVYDHRWAYVFEADPNSPDGMAGTLGQREVPLLRSFGEYVLVDYSGRAGTDPCDLRSGEFVIVSPLVRPVVGMSLNRRTGIANAIPNLTTIDPPMRDFKTVAQSGALVVNFGDVVRQGK